VSLVIAACYLVVAGLQTTGWHVFRLSLLLLLALACIWFGDELGDYTGYANKRLATRRTPGTLMRVFGWLLLALPVIPWVMDKME
jgi:hypothetical protein